MDIKVRNIAFTLFLIHFRCVCKVRKCLDDDEWRDSPTHIQRDFVLLCFAIKAHCHERNPFWVDKKAKKNKSTFLSLEQKLAPVFNVFTKETNKEERK